MSSRTTNRRTRSREGNSRKAPVVTRTRRRLSPYRSQRTSRLGRWGQTKSGGQVYPRSGSHPSRRRRRSLKEEERPVRLRTRPVGFVSFFDTYWHPHFRYIILKRRKVV